MGLGIKPFTHGMHDVGEGCYAWIQPDGGWGWSNAGLVVDGDESLLVDTLFDLKLTREMLAGMRAAEPNATRAFDKLVNWIDACDYMLGLPVATVVPGHGPITDKRGVQAVRDYLVYIRDEAKRRYDAGMSAFDAAMDISLVDYDSWGDAERIAVNVATLYREFGAATAPANPLGAFEAMARIRKAA